MPLVSPKANVPAIWSLWVPHFTTFTTLYILPTLQYSLVLWQKNAAFKILLHHRLIQRQHNIHGPFFIPFLMTSSMEFTFFTAAAHWLDIFIEHYPNISFLVCYRQLRPQCVHIALHLLTLNHIYHLTAAHSPVWKDPTGALNSLVAWIVWCRQQTWPPDYLFLTLGHITKLKSSNLNTPITCLVNPTFSTSFCCEHFPLIPAPSFLFCNNYLTIQGPILLFPLVRFMSASVKSFLNIQN